MVRMPFWAMVVRVTLGRCALSVAFSMGKAALTSAARSFVRRCSSFASVISAGKSTCQIEYKLKERTRGLGGRMVSRTNLPQAEASG